MKVFLGMLAKYCIISKVCLRDHLNIHRKSFWSANSGMAQPIVAWRNNTFLMIRCLMTKVIVNCIITEGKQIKSKLHSKATQEINSNLFWAKPALLYLTVCNYLQEPTLKAEAKMARYDKCRREKCPVKTRMLNLIAQDGACWSKKGTLPLWKKMPGLLITVCNYLLVSPGLHKKSNVVTIT